jgi:hypothetical protein
MTFQQLSELDDLPERVIAFEPPRGSESLINELPGHESYNSAQHVLRLLKPAYGLRDAPKAWRTALDKCLQSHGLHQIVTDSGIYCSYDSSGSLELILSCHVDDLNIAAKDAPYARLKSALEKSFGKLTEKCAYESSLEHCGIIYEQLKDYSIKTHQLQYALQLKTADIPAELASAPSTVLTPALLGTYR